MYLLLETLKIKALRFIKCYALSAMMYGCEIMTINEMMEKQLEETELWLLWRVMKICWLKVKNKGIMRSTTTARQLCNETNSAETMYVLRTYPQKSYKPPYQNDDEDVNTTQAMKIILPEKEKQRNIGRKTEEDGIKKKDIIDFMQ